MNAVTKAFKTAKVAACKLSGNNNDIKNPTSKQKQSVAVSGLWRQCRTVCTEHRHHGSKDPVENLRGFVPRSSTSVLKLSINTRGFLQLSWSSRVAQYGSQHMRLHVEHHRKAHPYHPQAQDQFIHTPTASSGLNSNPTQNSLHTKCLSYH